LRPHGIKVGTICPGGVKTDFAISEGRTEEGGQQSNMLEANDVAAAVLFACTRPKGSCVIQMQMRTMADHPGSTDIRSGPPSARLCILQAALPVPR
jgi:NADP-dependent 3-hydroxy acid dehydrogenase YdfG